MKEKVLTGIVLKVSDYKDSDKLAKIFTLEEGIISAVFKGVKKSGAKLKFFAQPFSFCNFEIICSSLNTVKSAAIVEELFSVCYDYERFSLASVILEAVEQTALEEANPELFFLLLKSLNKLVFSKANPYLVTTYFLSKTLLISGYSKLLEKPENPKSAPEIINFLLNSDENFVLDPENENIMRAYTLTVSGFERNFALELKSKKATFLRK